MGATALQAQHEVVPASRHRSALRVDLTSPASIRGMYAEASPLDGVVCTAGPHVLVPWPAGFPSRAAP